jgi:hypothetical protein
MNADLPGQYLQMLAFGEAIEPMYADRHDVAFTPRAHKELLPNPGKSQRQRRSSLCRPGIEEMIARTQFEPDAKDMLRRWRTLPLLKLITGRQDDFTSSF